jgi:FtsZ-interacting cell division protein ZipA
MVLLVIFLGVAIVYYLFQKNKISRMEKQEYLQDKKQEKFEQLLDLDRKQDAAKSEEEKVNKSNNLEN